MRPMNTLLVPLLMAALLFLNIEVVNARNSFVPSVSYRMDVPVYVYEGAISVQFNSVAVSDYNRDGIDDFIAAVTEFVPGGLWAEYLVIRFGSKTNPPFAIGFQVADVAFRRAEFTALRSHGSLFGLALGRWDLDSDIDLAFTNALDSKITIVHGGDLNPQAELPVGSYPNDAVSGDFNGDGQDDIATANFGDNSVSVLLNNGFSTFRSAYQRDVGRNPKRLVASDLNGDGKSDLAVADYSSGGVSVLLDVAERAGRVTRLQANDGPSDVTAGDLNGDGKPDLAVTSSNANTLSIFLNKGDGTFSPKVDYAVGGHPEAVVMADCDGDGQLDVVVANETTSAVIVFHGASDGTVVRRDAYSVGKGPTKIVKGDFNDDGRIDLLTLNTGDRTFSVLLGSATGVKPGDLDRDGAITTMDVRQLLDIYLGRLPASPGDIAVGDVRPKPGANGRPYGDGRIGQDDLKWVLRAALGLETSP